ncbi:MAG TPA: chemotaxis protein CheX [Polyangiaceae bacterium]|nr:chemotaxis protein CheX [Polyangiaceae bacterium]
MNEQWQKALGEAVGEVFESLCFMMPAPSQGSLSPEPAGVSRLVLAVDFRGAARGSLQLTLPDSMIASVASSMLGEDGPLELSVQYDAACELANIVCGNVLPRIAGERAVFDLASPRVIATRGADFSDVCDASASVLLDEGLVCASLELKLEAAGGER